MVKKMGFMGVLVAGLVVLGSTAAFAAVPTAAGQGQTPLGAALGFNLDANGAGQLTYTADPLGATPGFWAQCDGFTTTIFGYNKHGVPVAKAWATCTDQDGNTVYMRASFVDRGEPGDKDHLCIVWAYTPNTKEKFAYIHDMGRISAGNLIILQ
jgi:hypothetical protein